MIKILIVDDDVSITTLLDRILNASGFEAVVVNESAKTMDMARASNPERRAEREPGFHASAIPFAISFSRSGARCVP